MTNELARASYPCTFKCAGKCVITPQVAGEIVLNNELNNELCNVSIYQASHWASIKGYMPFLKVIVPLKLVGSGHVPFEL